MRDRLIHSTLLIAVLTVLTLGVPLAVLARIEVSSSAQEALQQEVATVAGGLEDLLDSGQPITAARIDRLLPGRRVIITTAGGQHLAFGPAERGGTQRATTTLAGATITVEDSSKATDDRVTNVTLFVMGLSAAAIAAAVALAIRQAKQLAAPLASLAARADSLGNGDFAGSPLTSGIPEIDTISRELERSATQIGTLVGLQRDFASDAAHQLRTPLTGIGLRLEEIAYLTDGPVQKEAEDALTQVERLNNVISSLLARARGDAAEPTKFDVGELIRNESVPWERVLARHGRHLTLHLQDPTPAFGRREHVATILASLLDNAVAHGSGDVSIETSTTPSFAVITVNDEGTGVPAALGDTVFDRSVSGAMGTGIGLALAQSLAASENGGVSISPASRASLILRLPSGQGRSTKP